MLKFPMHILPSNSQASRVFLTMNHISRMKDILRLLFFMEMVIQLSVTSYLFFSFVNKLNILHRDNVMQFFANSLEKKTWTWFCGLPGKCITSHEYLCAMIFERWHDGEGDMMTIVERTLTYLNEKKEPMISIIDEDTQDDPTEELHEEPMIEQIVEDSPHVTITENIEDLRYFQVCCNANIF